MEYAPTGVSSCRREKCVPCSFGNSTKKRARRKKKRRGRRTITSPSFPFPHNRHFVRLMGLERVLKEL